MCPHPLLHLAVRAALTVEVSRRLTRAGQGRVEGAGRQWAGKEVIIWAQVVPLNRRRAGQAEILVVGTSASTVDPGTGERLLPSQHPDLNTEEVDFRGAVFYNTVVFEVFIATEIKTTWILKADNMYISYLLIPTKVLLVCCTEETFTDYVIVLYNSCLI